jgi:hypothetical protein
MIAIIHPSHTLPPTGYDPSALPLCRGSTVLRFLHSLPVLILLIRGLFWVYLRPVPSFWPAKGLLPGITFRTLFFLRGIFYQIFSCGASKRPWKVHSEGSGITPLFYSFESTAFHWLLSLSAPILPFLTAFLLWWLWLAVLLGHIWRHSIHIGTMVWSF